MIEVNKMRNVIGVIVFVVLASTCCCFADFNWYTASSNRIAYADGITPLVGHRTDTSVGCFLQLIYAGADGLVASQAYNFGDGIDASSDDQVVATSWIGEGYFGSPSFIAGRTSTDVFLSDIAGGVYYVRAWEAPAANYAAGEVPTSALYGDSAPWTNSDPTVELPSTDLPEFSFGGAGDVNNIGWTTALVAIPEPSVTMFAMLGMFLLAVFLKKQ